MKRAEQFQQPRAVHIGKLRRAFSKRIARAQHIDVQRRCQPVISTVLCVGRIKYASAIFVFAILAPDRRCIPCEFLEVIAIIDQLRI
jgi:hypothetical protein